MHRPWLRLLDPELASLKLKASDDPAARFDYARALNARARHSEAVGVLDHVLAEARGFDEAWFERIVAVGDGSSKDDLGTLHAELESLRDENPGHGPHRRNLGYVRILQQRLDDAERALRQALERNGQDCRALELMGLLCLQRDEPQEAKHWILKALSLQPKDARPLRLLGQTYEQLGDAKAAEAQYAAAVELEPNYFWGWHALGELLVRRGDMEAGLRCISHARSLCAGVPASHFLMCELFSELGHLDLAQGELHILMALAPRKDTLADAYSLLGELRRDQGDKDGAVSYFSLATETDPEAVNPWVALGDLAREEERMDDAKRCYREALSRDPEAADIHVQLGYVFLKSGQCAEAEQSFLAGLETDPGEYSAYLGLSECCRIGQRADDQMRMVKEAMALAPEDADVWNALGVAYEVANRPVEATEAYEKALALTPDNRKAANNLGFLLEKRMQQGELDLRPRAIDAWKRRLLISRDAGQSLKMAHEHLLGLSVPEEQILQWLTHDQGPRS